MLKFKDFKKMDLNSLNRFKGGRQDTSYKKDNGYSYRDYEYADNEFNQTDSHRCQCNVHGGTDKTDTLICND
jgi:hypothetical protein